MEKLLNSTRDSAIGSVASLAGSDKDEMDHDENAVVSKPKLMESPKSYCPPVEDISEDER